MASIGNPLPATNSGATANSASGNSPNAQSALSGLGNTSTFLSLLVAQLQNQDPTNPVDGTAFVTQLAEFNNVEQSLAIRTDMDAVSEKYLGSSTPPSATVDSTGNSTQHTQRI